MITVFASGCIPHLSLQLNMQRNLAAQSRIQHALESPPDITPMLAMRSGMPMYAFCLAVPFDSLQPIADVLFNRMEQDFLYFVDERSVAHIRTRVGAVLKVGVLAGSDSLVHGSDWWFDGNRFYYIHTK